MKIEGSYIFNASPALLWSMLRDPKTLAKMLPSCERFDQINATQFEAALHIHSGPLSGEYQGTIKLSDLSAPVQMTLFLEGTGSQGPIIGNGRINIVPNEAQCQLHYEGEVTVNGRNALRSPRLVQTTANALIRQFMDAMSEQVQIQTGIYTTSMEPLTEVTPPPRRIKRTMTIDKSELLAEIRRDRRTSYAVVLLFMLLSLFFVGLIALGRGILNWLTHYFVQRLDHELPVESNNKPYKKC